MFANANGQYSVEVIESGPEAGEVSDEYIGLVGDRGFRVKRGSRTRGEFWLSKELGYDPEFAATPERIYPFRPGQFIGLMRFTRKGNDFRDQSIGKGWYTLRYALQPINGNHEGTSPTRDFLVMVGTDIDEPGKEWSDEEELYAASTESTGAAHPAMLCFQPATDGDEMELRHDEQNDWWIIHLNGNGVAGDSSKEIPIDLVVDGHAAE